MNSATRRSRSSMESAWSGNAFSALVTMFQLFCRSPTASATNAGRYEFMAGVLRTADARLTCIEHGLEMVVGQLRRHLKVGARLLVAALAKLQDAQVVERLGVVAVDRYADLQRLHRQRQVADPDRNMPDVVPTRRDSVSAWQRGLKSTHQTSAMLESSASASARSKQVSVISYWAE